MFRTQQFAFGTLSWDVCRFVYQVMSKASPVSSGAELDCCIVDLKTELYASGEQTMQVSSRDPCYDLSHI